MNPYIYQSKSEHQPAQQSEVLPPDNLPLAQRRSWRQGRRLCCNLFILQVAHAGAESYRMNAGR